MNSDVARDHLPAPGLCRENCTHRKLGEAEGAGKSALGGTYGGLCRQNQPQNRPSQKGLDNSNLSVN